MANMPYLYRVLRPEENPIIGLQAENPKANYTVLDHVSKGYLHTQYISTCATTDTVWDFANKGMPYAQIKGWTEKRNVVEIDVQELQKIVPSCLYYNLTDTATLDSYIPINMVDNKARNFATKFAEVLIQVPNPPYMIPAECIKIIGTV